MKYDDIYNDEFTAAATHRLLILFGIYLNDFFFLL